MFYNEGVVQFKCWVWEIGKLILFDLELKMNFIRAKNVKSIIFLSQN